MDYAKVYIKAMKKIGYDASDITKRVFESNYTEYLTKEAYRENARAFRVKHERFCAALAQLKTGVDLGYSDPRAFEIISVWKLSKDEFNVITGSGPAELTGLAVQAAKMEKEPGIKRVHILFLVLVGMLIPIIYTIITEEREARERRQYYIDHEELLDYHNQPNNPYGAPVVYYGSDLDRIVGGHLREAQAEMAGYSCTKYRSDRSEPTVYDDLTFYIFMKESYADKALAELKENEFEEITDEGGDYVRGWLNGVEDARIERYYYINGNLMVVADVTCIDEHAGAVEDLSPGVYGGGEAAEELIRLIRENF